MPFKDRRPSILLVDDEPANLHVLKHILQDDYRLLFARDGERALELASNEHPQLILLDVMMPGTTGHEVCTRLKADPRTEAIPVIFVTALANPEDEALGFELGAVDYISKPVSAPIVRARVRTHLSLVRAEVLRQTRLNIVQALGMAAEYKDNETGLHVIRMSHFSRIIALEAGFSAEDAEELLHAAPMHDVGKIGIPDAILQKPGKLDADEWPSCNSIRILARASSANTTPACCKWPVVLPLVITRNGMAAAIRPAWPAPTSPLRPVSLP